MDRQEIINTYYPAGSELRKILEGHSRQVADMALAIARRLSLEIPPQHIEDAAMLHDIGICRTDAPGILCFFCLICRMAS